MSYVRVPDRGAALRLHLNENTAGCSPAVLAALRAIDREDTAYYPDYTAVTEKAAAWFGVPLSQVQLINGLDEGLHVVAQWARRRTQTPDDPRTVLIVEPAFEMYAACAESAGLAATHLAPEPEFRFPLDELLRVLTPATRLIYLTDPNNPTGLPIPAGALARIAAAAPDAIVLVDEAYAEFSGRTMIGPELERHPNLVVGRTFAKAHGLAALRVGALIAAPQTLQPLRQLLPPYSLNICAVRALTAALGDAAYLEWYVAQANASKHLIYEWCTRRGLAFWPSEGNFVLLRVGAGATAVVGALSERGIQIRDRSGAPGCAGCVRITAGVVAATERCLTALEDVLAASTR
jgi:histidinol-phosphate aminotransferase